MPFQFAALLRDDVLQAVDPFSALLDHELPLPLEGGMRFRNEGADTDVDLPSAPAVPVTFQLGLPGQFGDGLNILPGLGRQTDHEIEFHDVPTESEGVPAGGEQILLADPLVDKTAEALAACLRGDREAGFPDPFDLIHH